MRSFSMLAAALLLAACSGGEVRETLGLNKRAPDEFTVVSRPPLTVPREFNLLPPNPGEERLSGQAADTQARSLVTSGRAQSTTLNLLDAASAPDSAAPAVTSAPLASGGEEHLLQRVGAAQADPKIREKLYEERSVQARQDPDLIDKLR